MNNKSATLRTLLVAMLFATCATLQAQIGSHRNDLSVGVNGGYVMNSVGFDPKVPQKQAGGITGGLSVRYVCEKYFSTICSILAIRTVLSVFSVNTILTVSSVLAIRTILSVFTIIRCNTYRNTPIRQKSADSSRIHKLNVTICHSCTEATYLIHLY